VVLQPSPEEKARSEEPVQVWLHNDDYTPAAYVVDVLREVFGLGWWRANWVMSRAHFGGRCLVGRYPRQEAEAKLAAAHGRARADGWPLRFSVEEA
jgi:ATP-dependent Clp protease adaptor protein ClpS